MTVEAIARAAWALEISWTAFSKGIFRLGFSTLDGGDTLGASFADPRWSGDLVDATAGMTQATVRMGASSDLTSIDAASMTVELDDPDGIYNAENTASPLYGLLEDRMHPVRLRATYPIAAPVFSGFVRKITPDLGRRRGTVTLDCVDLFYWLDDAHPVIANIGPETTGHAIGRILDAIGYLGARRLDRGDDLPNGFSADGSDSALGLIGSLLEAERGRFWIAEDGVPVYEDRHARLNRPSSTTISNEMTALSPGVDTDRVVNMLDVTDAGGVVAHVEHHVSRLKFGDKAGLSAIDTPYVFPGQGESLGLFVLARTATPRPPLRDLTVDSRTAELLEQILTVGLADVVTVEEAKLDTAGDWLVESKAIQVTRAAGLVQASYVLSKPEVNAAALYLGVGLLGLGELVY